MTVLLERLTTLANNLWWSWDAEATALWEEIDAFRWERHGHNPIVLLKDVEPARWEGLAADGSFVARVQKVHDRFKAYLAEDGWCRRAIPPLQDQVVAYFSMEFGLHESLHLYSGGLGVLAGDHLRSASDLGVPLVGVSLLYRSGYFRQIIDDGRQIAAFPEAEWSRLPVRPCLAPSGEHVEVGVPLAGRTVRARLWQLDVGRCKLVLLDTDYDSNAFPDRDLTRQLYGGDEGLRIQQEAVLGIGGVRALAALRMRIGVCHLNEGHCAFVPLALLAETSGVRTNIEGAIAEVRARCVFTTHTPVPAGHDRFPRELVETMLGPWCDEVGVPRSLVMSLGKVNEGDPHERLCMTVLALKTSAASNGVSALHGAVSRRMWQQVWRNGFIGVRGADVDPDQVPIHHVTNGVHPVYWMAPEARRMFDRYLPEWREHPWDDEVWAAVDTIPDSEWLTLRNVLRLRLVHQIGLRAERRFDPEALTIGFARRFAPYKRGNLLFRHRDRLAALLEKHHVQFVFAGKAHPRDWGGKEVLSDVVRTSEQLHFRNSIVLLQDYDMALGRLITAGADVWLNNPRRPQEASGTSGQKVILNGGLNLSVLDGWWPEGFDGTNGWAIGSGEEWADEGAQDAHDANALYEMLENQVIPEWEARDEQGVQHRWIERIRRSVRTCAPKFNSHRMVHDYVLQFYAPRFS